MISKNLFLLLILLILFQIISSQQFNQFKSYRNEKIRPKNYAKVDVPHDIDEYLTENQKYMKKQRLRPNNKAKFDNNWSGFNNKSNNSLRGSN